MKRKTYNDYNADWYKAHPELVALRQLAGVDDDHDEAARYAAEQSAPEPQDEIHDYRDVRG